MVRWLLSFWYYLSVPSYKLICRLFGTYYKLHLQKSCYRHFGTTSCQTFKIRAIGCPETSAIHLKSTLCDVQEGRRSYSHRGGSLETRLVGSVICSPDS
jgi:hypothetical protein